MILVIPNNGSADQLYEEDAGAITEAVKALTNCTGGRIDNTQSYCTVAKHSPTCKTILFEDAMLMVKKTKLSGMLCMKMSNM